MVHLLETKNEWEYTGCAAELRGLILTLLRGKYLGITSLDKGSSLVFPWTVMPGRRSLSTKD
jgi:hypothetical protein